MDEIINYVMDTPGNTNPNILRGMLEELNSGSGESVTYIEDINNTLDHTYAEILELIENEEIVAIIHEEKIYYIGRIWQDEKTGLYTIMTSEPLFGVNIFYEATHTDDYPIIA